VVGGKMWLIGRAYAAPIERASGESGQGNVLYAKVAEVFVNSGIDEWLDSLGDITRVDYENVSRILRVHRRFIDLLKQSTGRERRSFASKYLHFHRPQAFFIYDSLADAEIRKRVRDRGRFPIPAACKQFDPPYTAFCTQVLGIPGSRTIEV
jgi:hypothetical protein